VATQAVAPSSTRRERWAWYLYDFGNSAYASVVLLAVYSAYFQGQVVGGKEGSRLWGWSIFIAMLVVALSAPILGSIADFSGSKKPLLLFFTAVSVLFTAGLFFAKPGMVAIGMGFFIVAEIGYRAAQVFYDAFLPELASQEEMGRVAGNGWAIGTVGGIVALLLILPLVVLIKGTFIVRTTMIITAVFWALATIPLILWLPEKARRQPLPEGKTYLSIAFQRLGATFRAARGFREFIKFMIAFFIYNDGIIMALDFAAIIGAVLFGMTQEQLIIFMIIVQVTNVLGAYVFGHMVDRIGGKPSLVVALILMLGVIIWLFFNQTLAGFFLVGAVAGVAMAGAQSVSRTMVGVFAPQGKSAEFYGLAAFTGRTSSVLGPWVYGQIAFLAATWYEKQGQAVSVAEQSGMRVAILSIAAFILVGLILLLFVDEKKGREAGRTSIVE
jgi:MFS transporter, UMF1 family